MITGWAMITGSANPRRWRHKLRLARLRRQMKRTKAEPERLAGGKDKDDRWIN